ncbi:MAG: response regulator transcription factor [Rhodospirillales bacterium]|nr:response regulator transcription factor [Rhodospirillales bacterium]
MFEQSSQIQMILVDDDDEFRQPVKSYLTRNGFAVQEASTVQQLLTIQQYFTADIVVLDLNLPGESGLSILQELSQTPNLSIVIASARTGPADRVLGLSLGADYYLEKPIDLKELEVVSRKLGERVKHCYLDTENTWIFDANEWTLTSPENEKVNLSATEYTIVAELSSGPGEPVSREHLLNCLDRFKSVGHERTLDVLISRLRKKFYDTKSPLPLRSARGIGYIFPDVKVRGRIRKLSN